MVYGKAFSVPMKGFSDMRDSTGEVETIVCESKIASGIAEVFATGSTASITTVEYELASLRSEQP